MLWLVWFCNKSTGLIFLQQHIKEFLNVSNLIRHFALIAFLCKNTQSSLNSFLQRRLVFRRLKIVFTRYTIVYIRHLNLAQKLLYCFIIFFNRSAISQDYPSYEASYKYKLLWKCFLQSISLKGIFAEVGFFNDSCYISFTVVF